MGAGFAALQPLLPIFLSYVLSFIYLGIYWNNHHHLLHCAPRVNGAIMWANLHLLFWLSLFPFVTGWAGENHFAALPSAIYGTILLFAAIAYYILQTLVLAQVDPNFPLARSFRHDFKGKLCLSYMRPASERRSFFPRSQPVYTPSSR